MLLPTHCSEGRLDALLYAVLLAGFRNAYTPTLYLFVIVTISAPPLMKTLCCFQMSSLVYSSSVPYVAAAERSALRVRV